MQTREGLLLTKSIPPFKKTAGLRHPDAAAEGGHPDSEATEGGHRDAAAEGGHPVAPAEGGAVAAAEGGEAALAEGVQQVEDDELFGHVVEAFNDGPNENVLLCAVCQQAMDPQGRDAGGKLAACGCAHVFHESCLESVYRHGRPRGWCPVCRVIPGGADGADGLGGDPSQLEEGPAAPGPAENEIVL